MRVLSSIRVKIIVQLIVLAIQKCVKDGSPYVRKATAHAISKVFSLDKEQKSELTEIIKILLADKVNQKNAHENCIQTKKNIFKTI